MERMAHYDEASILKKLPNVSKPQFSNQKAHLYKELLASLRQSYLNHDIDIQLREQLDYIRLLYKKGLYDQSLRLLNRAKNVTGQYRKDLFQLSLLDYEKQIRSQQVFDLEADQVYKMDVQTEESMTRFRHVQHFFSVAIKLKARFIERGVIKNEQERLDLEEAFGKDLAGYDESTLAFNEQFYLYRAQYWYAYLTYDFESCTHYAEKWVKLFESTEMDNKRRAAFLKGLNRLLQSAFRANNRAYFDKYYNRLLTFDQQTPALASNTSLLLTKYRAIQLFNSIFIHANFNEQLTAVEDTLEAVEVHKEFMDRHTWLIINYKAAIYFFALYDYERALELVNHVINDKGNLRSDLKGFARIVRLIIFYEQADEERLERKVRTAYAYLKQQENLGDFQVAILEFIKNLGNIYPQDIKRGFTGLKTKLELLKEDKYQSKPLLYFDIISYLDAKIEGKPFSEIVGRKAQEA